jgi:hypothetical protein
MVRCFEPLSSCMAPSGAASIHSWSLPGRSRAEPEWCSREFKEFASGQAFISGILRSASCLGNRSDRDPASIRHHTHTLPAIATPARALRRAPRPAVSCWTVAHYNVAATPRSQLERERRSEACGQTDGLAGPEARLQPAVKHGQNSQAVAAHAGAHAAGKAHHLPQAPVRAHANITRAGEGRVQAVRPAPA